MRSKNKKFWRDYQAFKLKEQLGSEHREWFRYQLHPEDPFLDED